MMTMAKILLLLATLPCLVQAGTNAEGLEFLEKNKALPGVVTLESGLQYKVLQKGEGAFHPGVSSPCSCHYAGTLIDGTKFDSSYDRGSPTSFAPNQVIKGWTEAMQLMVEGDKWELYIPSELGYGDSGSPPKIPGGSVLVFTMEILSIDGPESELTPAIVCDVVTKEKCTDKEKKYLDKIDKWDDKKKTSEMERLSGLANNSMKPELKLWIKKRKLLLEKLSESLEKEL